jgi:hypothetical protein
MDEIRILKRALDKAINNGWHDPHEVPLDIYWPRWDDDQKFHLAEKVIASPQNLVVALIFSHDFAKAFFGEKDEWEPTACTCGGVDFHIAGPDAHKPECAKVSSPRGYGFHLQQLAVIPPEERLHYLEQFLQ